jgi:hypothetical protein
MSYLARDERRALDRKFDAGTISPLEYRRRLEQIRDEPDAHVATYRNWRDRMREKALTGAAAFAAGVLLEMMSADEHADFLSAERHVANLTHRTSTDDRCRAFMDRAGHRAAVMSATLARLSRPARPRLVSLAA